MLQAEKRLQRSNGILDGVSKQLSKGHKPEQILLCLAEAWRRFYDSYLVDDAEDKSGKGVNLVEPTTDMYVADGDDLDFEKAVESFIAHQVGFVVNLDDPQIFPSGSATM